MPNFHSLSVEEAARLLDVDPENGLGEGEVLDRRERHGFNELPAERRHVWASLLFRQLGSALTQVLLVAAALAWYVGETADAVGILVAVLIDVVASLIQESRAEKAIEKLKGMVVREASVIRGGETHRVAVRDLVPGDIIALEEGDSVPADARLVVSDDLLVVESALTGESEPVAKDASPVPAESDLADRASMVYMGTSVARGSGRALVTAVGGETEFGRIAVSLGEIKRPPTPLEEQVGRLGRVLSAAALAVVAGIFALGLLFGDSLFETFLFAVSFTVSIIPEGLPAVLAVVLAIGVQRMARRRAVIRRLKSVDTLGAVDVICTDKTGTLTENSMTVREIALAARRVEVTGDGLSTVGELRTAGRAVALTEAPELDLLLRACALVPKAELERRDDRLAVVGDPTEGALLVAAAKAGLVRAHLKEEYVAVDEVPFGSTHKYRAVLKERVGLGGERERFLFVVGAFSAVKRRAVAVLDGGKEVAYGQDVAEAFEAHNAEMAGRALRVLAVAYRSVPPGQDSIGDSDVGGLTLLGLVGMIDPPRHGVAAALERCRGAGIRVVMVTGDQKLTALAVAREIGLISDDEEDVDTRVFTEREVAAMDEAAWDAAVRRAVVFARATPQTKLRIVETLERQGKTVAMTGDGVNDAPALKKAGIGIAMGVIGTDVTREVADMVLADDNFVSIVSAIEEGRIIFRNVRQTTAYLFMTNFGEVAAVVASLLVGLPLPLLPAQILWMNLVTDGLPDMALATERSPEGVLEEPPRPRRASLLPRNTLVLAALVAAVMAAGTVALFYAYWPARGLAAARTVAFTAMSLFQLWNVFNMRSGHRSIFDLGLFSNKFVLWSVAISLAFQVAAVYAAPLQSFLRTVPLAWGDWLLIIVVTSSVFWLVEVYKLLIRRGVVPAGWMTR